MKIMKIHKKIKEHLDKIKKVNEEKQNTPDTLNQTSKKENNEEIRTMITAIGTGIGTEFNLEKLRYGKVILMCDADVDGSHIRTLMLTFFYRHMTELVEKGHIFIAQPPLYKIKRGKKEQYIETDAQLNDMLIDLAIEGIDITTVKTKQKLPEKKVKNLLSALMELERYAHTIEKREVRFSDYILMKNKKTKKMPLFKATVDGEDTFLYDEEELAALIQKKEKEKGKSLEIDDEISQGDVEESINLTEFYEAREIDKILAKIEDLDIETKDFGFCEDEVTGSNKEVKVRKPLYIIKTEESLVEIGSLKELLEHVRLIAKKGLTIQRYKGLGEMNPTQLWDTTMDPDKRVMQQVTVEDAVAADEMFTVLMGDQVAPRRSFIEKHAHEVKNLDV
jgi:DNA gyrase subunit B